MRKGEEHEKEEKKCNRCGFTLLVLDGRKAGYCQDCANKYKDAREAWEDKGLAKFCSVCGLMLHDKESIETGKCIVCRLNDGLNNST